MNKVWILFKRELKSQMSSASLYILAAIFIALLGYLFYNIFAVAGRTQGLTVESVVMRPVFGNINALFIFIIPLLAMRSFSEEKRLGTLNLLLLSPVSEQQVVAAKVLVGAALIMFFLSLTLIFPLLLLAHGHQNIMALLSSYMGTFLHAMCCFMLSSFASSLTKNSVLAAMLGIFGLLFFMSLSWTAQTSQNFLVSQIFEYLSLGSHYESFSRGAIRSYDLAYYMSFFGIFWLLTLRSLDARNW